MVAVAASLLEPPTMTLPAEATLAWARGREPLVVAQEAATIVSPSGKRQPAWDRPLPAR